MIINGLFSFFDGLIGVVEKLATTFWVKKKLKNKKHLKGLAGRDEAV